MPEGCNPAIQGRTKCRGMLLVLAWPERPVPFPSRADRPEEVSTLDYRCFAIRVEPLRRRGSPVISPPWMECSAPAPGCTAQCAHLPRGTRTGTAVWSVGWVGWGGLDEDSAPYATLTQQGRQRQREQEKRSRSEPVPLPCGPSPAPSAVARWGNRKDVCGGLRWCLVESWSRSNPTKLGVRARS